MLKVVFDAGSSQHGNTSRAAFFFGCIIKVHLDFIDGTAWQMQADETFNFNF